MFKMCFFSSWNDRKCRVWSTTWVSFQNLHKKFFEAVIYTISDPHTNLYLWWYKCAIWAWKCKPYATHKASHTPYTGVKGQREDWWRAGCLAGPDTSPDLEKDPNAAHWSFRQEQKFWTGNVGILWSNSLRM